MPSLKTKPEANVTLIFSTDEENGVLVFNGDSQHIAVELFRGRVRVSYDVGNYPASNMFRFVCRSFLVAIGKFHSQWKIQFHFILVIALVAINVYIYVFNCVLTSLPRVPI